ncbi:MAG TPA: rhodanese-like domain-containing protein [Gemmatimonadaceae bacterium]|nr:rhodanese-like domain-containing protein [Gemmatimonadaceae bacterium]
MVEIPPHKDHSPGFLAIVEDAKSRIQEISIDETRERLKSGTARLIDVREDHEWEEARIEGAEHLGKGIIERDIETVVPDTTSELILYCGGGFRAALVADVLHKMGYTNVKSMSGGWRAWLEAGGPIEEG